MIAFSGFLPVTAGAPEAFTTSGAINWPKDLKVRPNFKAKAEAAEPIRKSRLLKTELTIFIQISKEMDPSHRFELEGAG